MKRSSIFRKYASIIISVMLLLILIVGILGFNFYMSSQIAKDTNAINLASRQGILTKELAKQVLNIDLLTEHNSDDHNTPAVKTATAALQKTRNLFDKTLNAFEKGSQTTDLQGDTIILDQVINPEGIKSIGYAKDIWLPYRRLIDSYTDSANSGSINRGAITFASDYTRIFNDRLFSEMNDLNTAIAEDASKKTSLVQLVQTIGFVLALLLFLYIVFGALRRLFKTDRELDKARQETTNIMKTVKEGLFLLDESLIVGSQYSDELESILGKKDIAGRALNAIIKDTVSSKDFESTEDFIEQLFNEKVVEDLVHDLNPLDKVTATIQNASGNMEKRHLSFNFSRVYENKEISNVLVSIADITQEVELENRLEKERQQNEEQLEMLASILHVDANITEDFTNHVDVVCQKTNTELRRPEQSKLALMEKLATISREIHSIKGEASALNLKSFVTLIDNIETQVAQLKSKVDLTGNDFLSLTVNLDKLIELNNKVKELHQKLSGVKLSNETPASRSSNTSVSTSTTETQPSSALSETLLSQFVSQIAKRNNKEAILKTHGLDEVELTKDKQLLIKDIIIQSLRNAVVHGIESADERRSLGKPEQGNISVHLKKIDNQTVALAIQDDGRGIDFDTLQSKAEQQGYLTPSDTPPTKAQLLKFMFRSGTSTLSSNNEDAGRGVGMDVVKERIVSLSGKIKVESEAGQFTRFMIVFPL